ncbi:adenylate/guanylate cyclase domain-containing protein [Bradyrhizobium sp. CCBAU 11357]|uniref:adenylate/guanylate cyclase domain-containing protein n=1 Tax=Bradyrhizobium sp. CCBAU 11357 TaxID=1630808 RepID=UPI0023041286|nr:response regulator [Bradyrhizobium sp. CCBAU 11357]MDA9496001.1 guanylate cyclase [Bradyrhizobium sp. CCBAU 11357]
MHDPPQILIADDNENNRCILVARLAAEGYETREAEDGERALAVAREVTPDVILLDVMMPKIDGFEVCRRLKRDASLGFVPIIMVTARADSKDVVTGLNAGADEYLTKPVDHAALVARVHSMLRIKELHDRSEAQAAELASWNRTLEQRVAEQIAQIERVSRLKRFLSPQIAELILSSSPNESLATHRRQVTIVFCDLRGFTAFSEIAEPEEVMAVMSEYHTALGSLVHEFEGTLERFMGDGIMVIFGDPIPCPDPCARAVQMAVAMRTRLSELSSKWRGESHELGFGIGIAHGYATLGPIGFEGRSEYSAIGTVVNLAARLCAEARDGQILIDSKVRAAIDERTTTQPVGELTLKGLHRPITAYNVLGTT